MTDLRQLPAFEHAPTCPEPCLLYATARRPKCRLVRCVNCQRVGIVDVSRETSPADGARAEYQRLLAERQRLLDAGVPAAELDVPIDPDDELAERRRGRV